MAQKRVKKQVELIYNKNHFLMDSLRHITDVFGIMSLTTFCFGYHYGHVSVIVQVYIIFFMTI